MVRPKDDRTTTAVYDDHEVIMPPNRLVKAIKKVTVAMPGRRSGGARRNRA